MTPDGIYLVHFTHEGIPAKGVMPVTHRLVRADRFQDVEDWADGHVPDGYALATIEKQYAYRDLYEDQRPDAILIHRFHGGGLAGPSYVIRGANEADHETHGGTN